MKTLIYKNKKYPLFQSSGYAAKFAIPYAQTMCNGKGYDIGCMKKEWAFPTSIPIDLNFNNGFNATNLPENNVDYIFSSHCLEHIPNWVYVMEYWYSVLRVGGILFLYLPDYSQEYWRPWNNKKHLHIFSPQIIEDVMIHLSYINIFKSGIDLNNSFMICGEKA